ncbi:MAG: histidine phosphatase family protein [Campylobacterota bacterium]|nr:histidine phosphatase family protein [Campylobacterota bacterium]
MTLTLVRHAQVEETYIGCYNGHLDIGLSPKGYADAKNLGKYLNASDFDAIFCSDLIRAKETLKQFIQTDYIIYTHELREKSWGRHEGLSFDEIIAQGEIEYIDFEGWLNTLDGESVQEYTLRVKKFLFEYLPSLKKENILLVTHSGVIKTFISSIKSITLEEAFSFSVGYASFVVYNSETKELDFHD